RKHSDANNTCAYFLIARTSQVLHVPPFQPLLRRRRMTTEIFDRLLADGDETTAGNYFVANYPPFSFWQKDVATITRVRDVLDRPAPADTSLGVYFHIPFCPKRCHFCS